MAAAELGGGGQLLVCVIIRLGRIPETQNNCVCMFKSVSDSFVIQQPLFGTVMKIGKSEILIVVN